MHVFPELHRRLYWWLKRFATTTMSTIEDALSAATSDGGPHVASRVNKEARVGRGECMYSMRSYFYPSLSRFLFSFLFLFTHSHVCKRAHMHTLYHVRNVYTPRCMPVDCLPSADSQMISDRALLGTSKRPAIAASRSNQSVADSSAETWRQSSGDSDKETPPK